MSYIFIQETILTSQKVNVLTIITMNNETKRNLDKGFELIDFNFILNTIQILVSIS